MLLLTRIKSVHSKFISDSTDFHAQIEIAHPDSILIETASAHPFRKKLAVTASNGALRLRFSKRAATFVGFADRRQIVAGE
jgi:hypothetical protein